jgi:hypothetical protein
MTTTAKIVTKALQKIGIASASQPVSATDLNDGIDALNAMMHAWKLQGVDVSHVNLSAADQFSLGAEYEEGTIYLLASRLSPDYEAPQAFDADTWFRRIQAAYLVINDVEMPRALTRIGQHRRFWL